MGKNTIPDRWLPYSPMGIVVPGTRFIACKVPLKDTLLRSLPEKQRFGPRDLIEAFPKLGLLIDLTNTTRYYANKEFTDKNIRYEKIYCPGQVVPPNSIIKKFVHVVDEYLASEQDPDAVIVVHCTHGVNRTGYFICRYMIEQLEMSPDEALKNFQLARGHDIERETYVNDLKNGCKGGNEADLKFVPSGHFRQGGTNAKRRRVVNRRSPNMTTNTHTRFDERSNYREPYPLVGYERRGSQKETSEYYQNNYGNWQRYVEDDSRYMYNWRDQGDRNQHNVAAMPARPYQTGTSEKVSNMRSYPHQSHQPADPSQGWRSRPETVQKTLAHPYQPGTSQGWGSRGPYTYHNRNYRSDSGARRPTEGEVASRGSRRRGRASVGAGAR